MLNRTKKSFVSWADTFHPENGVVGGGRQDGNTEEPDIEVQGGERDGRNGGVTRADSVLSVTTGMDRWGVVWAEATLMKDDDDTSTDPPSSSSSSSQPNRDVKLAEATEITTVQDGDGEDVEKFENEHSLPGHHHHSSSSHGYGVVGRPATDTSGFATTNEVTNLKPATVLIDDDLADPVAGAGSSSSPAGGTMNLPYKHGNPITILLGSIMTLTSVCTVFGLDLSAAIIYVIACGFYHVCEWFKKLGGLWMFMYFIFMPVYTSLMLADGICLSLSILMTELNAGITMLLCSIFGRCDNAKEWHQYIRKLCHLTRWAVRGFHEGWTPERVFPVG